MEHPRISAVGSGPWQDPTAPASRIGRWTGEGTYSAFGVRWDVRADDPAAFQLFLDHMPTVSEPCRPARDGARSYALRSTGSAFELSADRVALARGSDLGELGEVFQRDLEWTVAERAPRRVFVRAAAVGWRDRVIVLIGAPRSGKRTLVRALVRLGATYFSDDYAVFDGTRVHPYPGRLPIWMEPGMHHAFLADGVHHEPKPLPVGIVVFTSFCPGALWRPKLLSRGQALLGLLGQAAALRRDPTRVLRGLDAVTRACRALSGPRGDAPGAAQFLLERLV